MSYYILGVLVAFVYSVTHRRHFSVLMVLIAAMLWPIMVPIAPFFWGYWWIKTRRLIRDVRKACESLPPKEINWSEFMEDFRKQHPELGF